MRLGRLSTNTYECALLKIPACNECPSNHLGLNLYDEKVVPKGSEFNDWNACASSSGSSIGQWYLDVLPIDSFENRWVCVLPLNSSGGTGHSSSSSSSSGDIINGAYECQCIRYQEYDPNVHKICGDIYPSEYDCELRKCNSYNTILLKFNNEDFVNTVNNKDKIESYDGCTTIQSKVGGASAYFDGSGGYLLLPGSAEAWPAIEDFTVEAWFRADDASADGTIVSNWDGNVARDMFILGMTGGSLWAAVTATAGDGTPEYISGGTIVSDRWHHAALTRNGDTAHLFLDGSEVATANVPVRGLGQPLNPMTVGAHGPSSGAPWPFAGYIDELRVVKGSALYTSDFDPSTEPPTNTPGTSLLMHFDDEMPFEDSSSNNFLAEKKGHVAIAKGQSVFGGSSGYFDGKSYLDPSGKLLLGSEDFKIEFWFRLDGEQEVYFVDYRREGDADTQNKPSLHMSIGSSSSSSSGFGATINWTVNGSNLISYPAPSLKKWHRISVARESGFTRMVLDGAQVGDAVSDSTKYVGSPTLFGSTFGGHRGLLRGYIDDFSISTNKSTLALLRFEGGFSDESGNGLQFQTAGNASTTQSQKKMGLSSAYFDGASSAYAPLTGQRFGNKDFTVEMWFKAASPGAGGQYATLASLKPHGFSIHYNHDGAGQGRIGFSTDHFQIASQKSFLDSKWHHVAAVRYGDLFSLYVDGNLEASTTALGAVIQA